MESDRGTVWESTMHNQQRVQVRLERILLAPRMWDLNAAQVKYPEVFAPYSQNTV